MGIGASVWLVASAFATTSPGLPSHTVCSTGACEFLTLEEGLNETTSVAGPHEFVLQAGDHVGGVTVLVPGTVIRGEPGAVLTADGSGAYTTFLIAISAADVTVSDLTILPAGSYSSASTGLRVANVGAVLSNLIVQGARSAGPAGGLYVDSLAGVVVDSCHFDDNQADLGGGMRVHAEATAEVRDSTFTNNLAVDSGGAISVTNATVDIVNTVFEGNDLSAPSNGILGGGAVAVGASSDVTLMGSRLSDNGEHAAVVATLATSLLVDDVIFEDESVALIVVGGGSVVLSRSTMRRGATGAAFVGVDQVDIEDTWACGTASGEAPLLSFVGSCSGRCELTDVLVAGQQVASDPVVEGVSGVLVESGDVRIDRSSVVGNTAAHAALWFMQDTMELRLEQSLLGANSGGPALRYDLGTQLVFDDLGLFDNSGGDAVPLIAGTPISPVLVAHDRCPGIPSVPVCGDPANDWIFQNKVGVGHLDADDDGVPFACDCDDRDADIQASSTGELVDCQIDDSGLTTTPSTPSTTRPSTPTGAPGTPGDPPAVDIGTSFLLGGGGCGCAASSGAVWPALTLALERLGRRRAVSSQGAP